MTEPYLKFDGLEEALIGLAWPWQNNQQKVAVYDHDKIIDILMERDGMEHEEAVEFLNFNIDGTYAGEQTPIIIFMGGDDDAH